MSLNITGIGLDPLININFVEHNRLKNTHMLAVKKDGSLKLIEKKTVNCFNGFLAFFGAGELKELSYTIKEVKNAVVKIINNSNKKFKIWKAVNQEKGAIQCSDQGDSNNRIITAIIEIQERAK